MPRNHRHSDDDDAFEDAGEQCPVCHQEYSNGICPIRSSECPDQEDELDEEEDLEEEESDEASDEDDKN